jgi:hypothetical protein
LLLMWALGLGFGVAGNLIHILLVVALVVLIVNVLQGSRVAHPPRRYEDFARETTGNWQS